jgi:hypothetical protein
VSERPSASELLRTPGALLSRSDLRALGLNRRAVDAVFRECPVVVLPGYGRPLVRVEAYLALLESSTYCDRCGDRVRPTPRLLEYHPPLASQGRPRRAADTASPGTTTDTPRGADR